MDNTHEVRRSRRIPRKPHRILIAALACVGLVAGGGIAVALTGEPHAGPQGDGTAYTPAGWRITPAGAQQPAGFFPANAVLAPDGRALLVPNIVHNKNGKQTVQVMDPDTGATLQELELDTSNSAVPQGVAPGLTFSHDGKQVFLATANRNSILVLGWDAAARKLAVQRALPLPNGSYPQTVAVSADDKTVYTAGQYSRQFIAVDVASGQSTQSPVAAYPYGVALSADGHTAYVGNQGANSLSVFTVDGRNLVPRPGITVGTHPNSMLLDAPAHRMFVANGDSDTVSVVDTATNAVTGTISLAPSPGAHAGTQPTNLALSADRSTLYVTNGGNNDVAVVNVGNTDFGRVRGLIPTGWYPTGVQVSKDGGHLLVVSAKGLGTGPNVGTDPSNPGSHPYVENQLQGYLSVLPVPNADELAKYTDQVHADNRDTNQNDQGDQNNQGQVQGQQDQQAATIVPRHVGDPSPIQHVIYVVKENRTYDQVLGDLGKGNGDPTQAIFNKDVTPNHHKLADQFVTLDNFYVNGEVSQNGWQWATQASSNPYNETATAQGYAGNGSEYDSEGYHPDIAAGSTDPAHAYLWDKLADDRISFRNYGQFVVPSTWMSPQEPVKCSPGAFCAHDPLLDANTEHDYPWFDMGVSDQHRFDLWHKEFDDYAAHDNLPSMEFIDLPRDHTAGGATAKQLVADNDQALGNIVDTVSHSKYWPNTAIFVVEDDAQSGSDHVDAHRTIAQVISPYTQTGAVDSHFYSQVSMLRTMELFLGVNPLSQYDAAALPMIYSFSDKANLAPYSSVTAPKVTATTSSPIAKPGQQFTVTSTVTNPGATPLSGANLQLASPPGWTVAPTSGPNPLPTLAPGATTSTQWTVTPPANAQPGQQKFTARVDYPINGRMTGTQSATVAAVVPDPRTATIPQAFVANFSSNSVTAVDLSTGKPLLDIPVGAAPGTVVVSPDHRKAFVANQNGQSVSVIDVAADAVVGTIPTGKVPAGLAVSPDGRTLWVSDYGDNAVQPVDLGTDQAGAEIPVGNGPENLAITPDGGTLLVADKSAGTVTPVATGTRTARPAIRVGSQPFGVAVTPDGSTAYVSNSGSGDVTPIDLATGTAKAPIPAGPGAFNVALSPDARTLFVADSGGNTVTPIDVSTGTAKAPITTGASTTGVAVSPDGATVYATAAGPGQLVPITAATGQVGTAIPVGNFPISVAVAPPTGQQPAAATQPITQSSPDTTPSINRSLVMSEQDMAANPDQANAGDLNAEIWRDVRGDRSPMPAPQHNLYGGPAPTAPGTADNDG